MNSNYEYIGYVGAALISINLVPQVYHIYHIKNADSISTSAIALNIISSIIMLAYGICIEQYPVIISNGMICMFYVAIGYFKYIFQSAKSQSSGSLS
jgi:uncharacterized protein with PQ loop repeat